MAVLKPPKKIQLYSAISFIPRLAARTGTSGYINGITVDVELEKKLKKAANSTMAPGTKNLGMELVSALETASISPASLATLISMYTPTIITIVLIGIPLMTFFSSPSFMKAHTSAPITMMTCGWQIPASWEITTLSLIHVFRRLGTTMARNAMITITNVFFCTALKAGGFSTDTFSALKPLNRK